MTLIRGLIQRRATQVISFKTVTGHTSSGDPVLSTIVTATARVERISVDRADGDGRSLGESTKIFTLTPLKPGDFVWLPGDSVDDINAAVRVVSSAAIVALDGTLSHFEVVAA